MTPSMLKPLLIFLVSATCSTMAIGQIAESFMDPAEFVETCGEFPLEDFEESGVLPAGVLNCGEPVGDTSPNSCFSPGELIEGFSLTSSNGNGTATIGSGFNTAITSVVVGVRSFNANTIITFDANDVTAVAFDIMSGSGTGNIQVEIYDLSNNLVSKEVSIDDMTPYYFAMSVPNPISRIVLNDQGSEIGELIDNLSFGACVPPIPSVGQWGLLILGLAMSSLGLVFMYASKRKEAIA